MLGVWRQPQPALLYAQRLVPPSDLQLCRSLYSCTDSGRRPSRNEPRGRQPLQPRDHRPALDELPWYVLNMHRPLIEPLAGGRVDDTHRKGCLHRSCAQSWAVSRAVFRVDGAAYAHRNTGADTRALAEAQTCEDHGRHQRAGAGAGAGRSRSGQSADWSPSCARRRDSPLSRQRPLNRLSRDRGGARAAAARGHRARPQLGRCG